MRYGKPSTKAGIDALIAAGCQKILLAPLYPQYSATTTATANDKAFEALREVRWQPSVRTLPAYFEERAYVEALAESIYEGVARLDFTPDVILTSYHGMPVEYLKKGDPYHCQCVKTTRLRQRASGLAGRQADGDVPEPVRANRMAAALYRRDADGAAGQGHQARRRGVAGLCRRLHRNAGRARHHRRASSSSTPAASTMPTSRASTIPRAAWICWKP